MAVCRGFMRFQSTVWIYVLDGSGSALKFCSAPYWIWRALGNDVANIPSIATGAKRPIFSQPFSQTASNRYTIALAVVWG